MLKVGSVWALTNIVEFWEQCIDSGRDAELISWEENSESDSNRYLVLKFGKSRVMFRYKYTYNGRKYYERVK